MFSHRFQSSVNLIIETSSELDCIDEMAFFCTSSTKCKQNELISGEARGNNVTRGAISGRVKQTNSISIARSLRYRLQVLSRTASREVTTSQFECKQIEIPNSVQEGKQIKEGIRPSVQIFEDWKQDQVGTK